MLQCSACGVPFTRPGSGRVVSISGSIMGDEYTETYYRCQACGSFTIEVCHDRFCGEETLSVRGPLTEQEGNEKVEMIRGCSRPWDKRCRCPVHREYFGDVLD